MGKSFRDPHSPSTAGRPELRLQAADRVYFPWTELVSAASLWPSLQQNRLLSCNAVEIDTCRCTPAPPSHSVT